MGTAAQDRQRTLLAVAVAALGLVVFDLGGVWLRGRDLSPLAVGIYALSSLGMAAACLAVVGLARVELQGWLSRLHGAPRLHGLPRGLLHGLLDGLGVWLIAVELGRPETIRGGDKPLALALLLLAGALAGIAAARTDKLARLGSVAVIAGAFAFDAWLPYREYAWMRLCLGAMIVAACARILAPLSLASVRRGARLGALLCVTSLLLADPLLRASVEARAVLQRHGTQGAAFARILWIVSDVDGDQAPNGFGAWDCAPFDRDVFPAAHEVAGDGVDGNCLGGDGLPGRAPDARSLPATPARMGATAGPTQRPDVLVLGFDGLRFDAADALEPLRRELPAIAELTRAVSASPRTMQSLPAMLRGRALRELRFAIHKRFGRTATPWLDTSTTLGQVLNAAGYRTLSVPTHRYLQRDSGVLDGFETLPARGVDGLFNLRSKLRSAIPIVTVKDASAAVLAAARQERAERPIAVFLHAMETHEPYRWGDGQQGPLTAEALRRSATETAETFAELLRQWRAQRGRPPLVAVYADHGEEFSEHGGRFHSTSVHAEQVRVVFWLAGPGVPAGRFDAPTSTTALPATLLELLGLVAAPTMTEPSLVPALRGEAPFPGLAVSELRYDYRQSVGYTGSRYRLLRDPVNRIDQLHDAELDPLEQRDLADELPHELERMRALARRWDETH